MDDKSPKTRAPRAFKLNNTDRLARETQPKAEAKKAPTKTPRKPRKIEPKIEIEFLPDDAAEQRENDITALAHDEFTPPPLEARKSGFSFSKLFFSALAGLFSLGLGLYVDGLVRVLFERNTWLGWVGVGLTALIVFAALAIFIRELIALLRLNSIEVLRKNIDLAHEEKDVKKARHAADELSQLYQNRPDTARGRAVILEQQNEIIDAEDVLKIAEKNLLAPLDEKAREFVMDAAKRVSIVTAISPRAVVDIAYVLMENFRLIRKLSQHYGGKPGILGFWRLTRTILGHLAVTGTLAAGDTLVQQFIGHGLAARLSARLGEGVLNGLLTARVGIAAIDICRPAPFIHQTRPTAGDLLKLNQGKSEK